MRELVERFVGAFQRGIEGELAAMKASAQAFEIALVRGEDLGAQRYRFELVSTDRLVAGTVCSLKAAGGEQRVTVERVERGERAGIVLLATQWIDLAEPCALVVAPWFLYDRLVQALGTIAEPRLALTLFGKQPPARTPTTLVRDHAALDETQRAAVQLCAESDLAFVWGPPGTGKTMTLVHVIDELVARGERILLASTTNAAIDQVLAKLAGRPWFRAGTFVRIGRSDAETYGTELGEICGNLRGSRRDRLAKLRARVGEVEQQVRLARALLDDLQPAVAAQQLLFAAAPRLSATALLRVFTAADAIARRDPREQVRVVQTRIARLDRVRALAKAEIAARMAEDRDFEARVVGEARVVLCTLTNVYLSPHLADQQFDRRPAWPRCRRSSTRRVAVASARSWSVIRASCRRSSSPTTIA